MMICDQWRNKNNRNYLFEAATEKLAGVGSKFGRADCSELCRYDL